SGRSRSRPTAIFSAAIAIPAPAAATPTASPPALVSRPHLLIGPPVDGEHLTLAGCYPRVASWNLTRKPRDDLVADRAERLGPLLRRRLARVAGPEQDHLVARLGGQVAQVDDRVVHVDGPGDREPPAAHEHLGGARRDPRDALVVAQR